MLDKHGNLLKEGDWIKVDSFVVEHPKMVCSVGKVISINTQPFGHNDPIAWVRFQTKAWIEFWFYPGEITKLSDDEAIIEKLKNNSYYS